MIIVPAGQGHFQPGKNLLSLKQLVGLTKCPCPAATSFEGVAETMINANRLRRGISPIYKPLALGYLLHLWIIRFVN